jgi:hypothetical protein
MSPSLDEYRAGLPATMLTAFNYSPEETCSLHQTEEVVLSSFIG